MHEEKLGLVDGVQKVLEEGKQPSQGEKREREREVKEVHRQN